MRQGLQMSQRLGLTQTLTPQMRMNLELIQAPIIEAVQSLEQQVMTNPWLERNEEATDPRFVRNDDVPRPRHQAEKTGPDGDEANFWADPVAATPWTHEEFPADEAPGMIAVSTPSPYEQLEAQIREMDLKREVQDLAIDLLPALDEHGYLPPPNIPAAIKVRRDDGGARESGGEGTGRAGRGNNSAADEEAAEREGMRRHYDEMLGAGWQERVETDPDGWLMAVVLPPPRDRAHLDEALHLLRYQLEPPGIGARNQSHSFLIQLERNGKGDSLAARLIRDGVLADIKPRNLDSVAKKLGVSGQELRSALEDLHKLHRNPFSLLDQTIEPTRYPDLVVEKVDGDWQVSLSHPLSGRYRYRETRIPRKSALTKENERDDGNPDDPAEILRRLRQMRQDARMLVRAAEYRDRTLYEIGTQLVREQREFLERGEEALRPLLQKELAERLGLNEATVSRILKEKYILTPRGLLPLNGFFSRAITNKRGEKIANKAIQDVLGRLLAEEEDPEHPWSDQEISSILRARGFPISRRTVTKYRMILGIGAAGDRKAQRKIQDAT